MLADSISIDDHVAIFAGCTVLAGAEIERGCVFSAMSLIKRGVYHEKSIYAGNPVKYVRDRNSDLTYEQNWKPIIR